MIQSLTEENDRIQTELLKKEEPQSNLQRNQALAKAEYFKTEYYKCRDNYDKLLQRYSQLSLGEGSSCKSEYSVTQPEHVNEQIHKLDEERCIASYNERKALIELKRKTKESEACQHKLSRVEEKLRRIQKVLESGTNSNSLQVYLKHIIFEKTSLE